MSEPRQQTDQPGPPPIGPHLTDAANDPDAGVGPAVVVILVPFLVAVVMIAGFLAWVIHRTP